MDSHEGHNVGREPSMGRGRGGCTEECTSGRHCQMLRDVGGLHYAQAIVRK